MNLYIPVYQIFNYNIFGLFWVLQHRCADKYDWVIGNPPYSIFEDFLRKGFQIADNVSYLLPTNKVFQRQLIMDMINEWGG